MQTTNKLSVRSSDALNDPQWDDFVASCPGGHHEQTSLWGQVKANYGWKPQRTVFLQNDEVVGGFQLLARRVKWLGGIGYVTRGPVCNGDDPELVHSIAAELDRTARLAGVAYLVIVPSYGGHAIVSALEELNFGRKPDYLPPTGIMQATLLVDLSAELSQLMAGLRRSTRKHVRRAYRAKINVRQGDAEDIETFRRLMWALCERRGTAPTPPQIDFFRNLWKVFGPTGHAKLFLAEIESEVVSAVLAFAFNDALRLWKIGWAGNHTKLFPNDILYWEAIKWAKSNGYHYCDLVGVDRDYAAAVLRGAISPAAAQKDGMAFFKYGFGGRTLLLPEIVSKLYNPAARLFVSLMGRNLLRFKPIKQTAY